MRYRIINTGGMWGKGAFYTCWKYWEEHPRNATQIRGGRPPATTETHKSPCLPSHPVLRGVDSSAQNWNCLLTRVRDDATKQNVASNSSGDEIAWFKTLTTPPSSCVFNISLSGCLIFDHRHTIYLVLPPCFDTTQENVRSLPTLPRTPHLLKALVTPQHAFSIRPAVDFDHGLCATTRFTDLLLRMPCGY